MASSYSALSPDSGRSTMSTSAPKSPSTMVQNMPGVLRQKSRTLMPSRANIDRLPDRLVRRSIIADAWNRIILLDQVRRESSEDIIGKLNR